MTLATFLLNLVKQGNEDARSLLLEASKAGVIIPELTGFTNEATMVVFDAIMSDPSEYGMWAGHFDRRAPSSIPQVAEQMKGYYKKVFINKQRPANKAMTSKMWESVDWVQVTTLITNTKSHEN